MSANVCFLIKFRIEIFDHLSPAVNYFDIYYTGVRAARRTEINLDKESEQGLRDKMATESVYKDHFISLEFNTSV